jgi:hypothetical protein
VYRWQHLQLTGTNRPRAWIYARAYSEVFGGNPNRHMISGGHSGGDTPVPIPNTAVKPARANGTWG